MSTFMLILTLISARAKTHTKFNVHHRIALSVLNPCSLTLASTLTLMSGRAPTYTHRPSLRMLTVGLIRTIFRHEGSAVCPWIVYLNSCSLSRARTSTRTLINFHSRSCLLWRAPVHTDRHAITQCRDYVTREYQRGKYHCTIDLLFDWFGLICFVNKKQKLLVVIQLIPNQSDRRSIVQWYFPL
jgi:hypothetical protein